jgi:ribose/xylose/arabinose/galactoside ABC-type transport system permease subunit
MMAFALALALLASIAAGFFMIRGKHPQLILTISGLTMLGASMLLV